MADFSNTESNTLISGTSGNDNIKNGFRSVWTYGGGNNVTISAANGDDTVHNFKYNGSGGDKVIIYGGNGNDSIYNEGGDSITVDYGAMVEGYMSDITRNFAIGKVNGELLKINDILLTAHKEAAKALRPGISGRDVDEVARKIISDSGYGENFLHGLGHGLGLEVHEAPRLSRSSKDILQIGDVVTIEPGIYIEGLGGLRIEDDYLITEDGSECLTVNDNQSIEII